MFLNTHKSFDMLKTHLGSLKVNHTRLSKCLIEIPEIQCFNIKSMTN